MSSLDRTRFLVIGTCKGFAELIEDLKQYQGLEFVGHAAQLQGALRILQQGRMRVVVLLTWGEDEWRAALTQIREYTDAPVVLISSDSSRSILDDALDAGVDDALLLPQPVETLAFAIRKTARTVRHRAADQESAGGAIGTVFSPKGGTGKTVVAANLAVMLAKQQSKRTLLLDLDLQFGDAALMLGIEPEKTLADLVAAPGELDGEKLAGYVTRHSSSGLDVLPAPLQPENAELVSDEKLGRVLEVAREVYDAIVVDTAPLFHGAMLTTLDWTDSLLLVCSRDVTGLKNVHLGLRTLSLLSFPPERVALVINSPHGDGALKRSEIENALGLDARVELPHDRGVSDGVNRGVPLVLAHKGPFAAGITELTRTLVPASPAGRRQRQRRWLPALGRA